MTHGQKNIKLFTNLQYLTKPLGTTHLPGTLTVRSNGLREPCY